MDFSSYTVEALTRRRPLTPGTSESGLSAKGAAMPSPQPRSGGLDKVQQQYPAQLQVEHQGLKRSLGLTDVIFYGVGCSVGAGIYSLVGIGAKLAGPSIAMSFLICGIPC